MENEIDPPFATATVARLYLEQGKLDQAERLFRRLIDQRPDDKALLEGLAEVQRRKEGAGLPPGPDRVQLAVAESIVCSWSVTPEGLDRAAMVLNEPGRLTLRVAAFPARTPKESERTISLDQHQLEGELPVTRPEGAKMMAAAVGMMSQSGRFVAVAHCRAVALAAPAQQRGTDDS